MKFNPPLEPGRLLRRYKRFLADVELPSGDTITIHCPNTGSMRACLQEGAQIWFSRSENQKRKYPCTWEIATTPAGDLAGVNTGRANGLVEEAIVAGLVSELGGYDSIRREVRYGSENSRIDLLLQATGRPDCYVEIKNVTLCEDAGQGLFPDSVSARGTKHLRELSAVAGSGARAVLFYCVQHSAITTVSPAWEIDPEYSDALERAVTSGVEVLAYSVSLSPQEIRVQQPLQFCLRPQR